MGMILILRYYALSQLPITLELIRHQPVYHLLRLYQYAPQEKRLTKYASLRIVFLIKDQGVLLDY